MLFQNFAFRIISYILVIQICNSTSVLMIPLENSVLFEFLSPQNIPLDYHHLKIK